MRMTRVSYPSDRTDRRWSILEPLIPPAEPGGRVRTVDSREVINGILSLHRTGCSWRMPPHAAPPRGTVHDDYRRFRLDGSWQRIHDKLREKVRRRAGKKPTPSAAIIDSQTVKADGGARTTNHCRAAARR